MTGRVWADQEQKSLESSSFWIMDRHTLETNFWISYCFGWSDITFNSISCKSTSPSEVISKLHERMDTFQMNPKAICADMAFHHLHDMQAFYRLHNRKILPTGPHTLWPSRAEMGERLFKMFLSALVHTASKNLDQTTLAQITPARLLREVATVRNTQVTLSGKTLVELVMRRRPRDLLDPAFMNPEQLTST